MFEPYTFEDNPILNFIMIEKELQKLRQESGEGHFICDTFCFLLWFNKVKFVRLCVPEGGQWSFSKINMPYMFKLCPL